MSETVAAQSGSGDAIWITPRVCYVCANCGAVSNSGLLATNTPADEEFPYLYLCRPCVEALVTAYVASSPDMRLIRVQVVEMPLAAPVETISPSDISVTITWYPASDPRSVDIQVSPEPTSGAAAALDLIEGALVRGCEYLSSYRDAAADDAESVAI